jgi:hypothetical protein
MAARVVDRTAAEGEREEISIEPEAVVRHEADAEAQGLPVEVPVAMTTVAVRTGFPN